MNRQVLVKRFSQFVLVGVSLPIMAALFVNGGVVSSVATAPSGGGADSTPGGVTSVQFAGTLATIHNDVYTTPVLTLSPTNSSVVTNLNNPSTISSINAVAYQFYSDAIAAGYTAIIIPADGVSFNYNRVQITGGSSLLGSEIAFGMQLTGGTGAFVFDPELALLKSGFANAQTVGDTVNPTGGFFQVFDAFNTTLPHEFSHQEDNYALTNGQQSMFAGQDANSVFLASMGVTGPYQQQGLNFSEIHAFDTQVQINALTINSMSNQDLLAAKTTAINALLVDDIGLSADLMLGTNAMTMGVGTAPTTAGANMGFVYTMESDGHGTSFFEIPIAPAFMFYSWTPAQQAAAIAAANANAGAFRQSVTDTDLDARQDAINFLTALAAQGKVLTPAQLNDILAASNKRIAFAANGRGLPANSGHSKLNRTDAQKWATAMLQGFTPAAFTQAGYLSGGFYSGNSSNATICNLYPPTQQVQVIIDPIQYPDGTNDGVTISGTATVPAPAKSSTSTNVIITAQQQTVVIPPGTSSQAQMAAGVGITSNYASYNTSLSLPNQTSTYQTDGVGYYGSASTPDPVASSSSGNYKHQLAL